MPDSTKKSPTGAVMVVGGGISGMQASLDLADSGFKVYLVERNPSIGGVMSRLDKTFPTNDCSTCIISPKLIEVAKHPNIEILAYSEPVSLKGDPGDFTVQVRRYPRYVNETRCVSCGICASKCPRKVPDEFNGGLSLRKAIYLPFPQAIPSVYTIDGANCIYFQKGKCRACEKFCKTKAIDFNQKEEDLTINVGAVILSPGFEITDPELRPEYGYGRYPNVLTALQYERILSAAGPYSGHIKRPSDGKEPKKIAWIQCVGSRDSSIGKDYCSYACCMYATKQSIISKEHDPKIEPTIFFIDLRAQGKGFERYYERAKEKYGVRYIRSMVSRVTQDPITNDLEVHYLDESGKFRDEPFEMIVLSTGFTPHQWSKEIAHRFSIETDGFGFCRNNPLESNSTSRDGIFVCGVFQGPKDIPESVVQASGASSMAMALLGPARGTLEKQEEYPPERDVSGEEPRVGVFVCHCGNNIAGVVDVQGVSEYAKTLPNVVYSTDVMFACSTDNQKLIEEAIKEHELNRVVVASCSPRTHEPLFQDTLKKAGLNPYLFEMANIRDQCSWVHGDTPDKATEKAKDLVRMSIARALLLEPLKEGSFEVNRTALVLGGGVAGMSSALNLAEQGFPAVIIEKQGELGGNARFIRKGPFGEDVQGYLKDLIDRVRKHPLINVYTQSSLIETKGHVGDFVSLIKTEKGEKEIHHGVTIVATGGEEYKPEEYLYGEHPKVKTQREFEDIIYQEDFSVEDVSNVVMIQCVGSRNEEHPYCSRVCCTKAVSNAIRLREKEPSVNVFILYRDIRTFGLYELLYKKARDMGIQFIRFEQGKEPSVQAKGEKLEVRVFDEALGEDITIIGDLLVLSTAIRPSQDSREISSLLKLPLDADGFFLEAHVKLRPIDFANSGYFLCGLAHGPKFLEESISQARGASSRASTILSKKYMSTSPQVAVVERDKCVLCLTCMRTCPFGVPKVGDDGFILIDASECQGCGSCASACPRKIIQLKHMRDDQIIAKEVALCGGV